MIHHKLETCLLVIHIIASRHLTGLILQIFLTISGLIIKLIGFVLFSYFSCFKFLICVLRVS